MTLALLCAVLLAPACAAERTTAVVPASQLDDELDRIGKSVERELPAGVRLLSVRRQDQSIVLDFGEELLSAARGGELEDLLHRLLTAASAVRGAPRPRVEDYRILINGVPLEKRIP